MYFIDDGSSTDNTFSLLPNSQSGMHENSLETLITDLSSLFNEDDN